MKEEGITPETAVKYICYSRCSSQENPNQGSQNKDMINLKSLEPTGKENI